MPKAKADIWIPIYIGDYLSDTMSLDATENGAYLLLIFHYWKTAKPISNNIKELIKVTRLHTHNHSDNELCSEHACSMLEALLKQFFELRKTEEGEFWFHSRIEQELNKSIENKEMRTKRAQNAAKIKYSSSSKDAQSILQGCPSPSPSPSVILKEKNIQKEKSSITVYGEVVQPKPRIEKKNDPRHEEFYALYPRKKSKHDSQKAFDAYKFTEKEFPLVMTALRMQISEWQKIGKEAQFLPYPATWIRAGSWNDCPDPATFALEHGNNSIVNSVEHLKLKEKAKEDEFLQSEKKRKDFESLLHKLYPDIFGDDLYHPLLMKKAKDRYRKDREDGLI